MANTKKEINATTSVAEEESLFLSEIDDILSSKETLPDDIKKTSDSKKPKYVFIRHNSSENYKDITKAAELGVDLFPQGFSRKMELSGIVKGNKLRFNTGLEEDKYKEQWELDFLKESKEILVKEFGDEVLDPFNMDFWKTRNITVDEDETILDLNNSDDLLTYWNIKGGGFPYIAKSPDELLQYNARFYLEEPHLTYEVNDDGGRVKDKAIMVLSELDEAANGFSNLFFLHKMLITVNEGITYNTPRKQIYKALRNFIDGQYNGRNKKSAPKQFQDAVNILRTNNKKARIIAIVNDAMWYGVLSTNRDNHYINNETAFNFKTNDKNKIVDMLMTPTHNEEVLSLLNEVQKKWNKY